MPQTKRIPLLWLQDLGPQEDKEAFEKSVRHFLNSSVGRKFIKIVTQKLDEAERIQVKEATYDKGAWPYYQAHLNGYKAFGRDLIDLMKFGEEV